MFTSALLFCHKKTMKMYFLIGMACDFASLKPRDIAIGISLTGYSVGLRFSWFKNYKLYQISN